MATLFIAEYKNVAYDGRGGVAPVAQEPADTEQDVTFTTATQSSAFGEGVKLVRLQADADCHVKFGSDPTATASHQPLQADTEYWRGVSPGDKVSVYDGTS